LKHTVKQIQHRLCNSQFEIERIGDNRRLTGLLYIRKGVNVNVLGLCEVTRKE